MAMKKTLLEIVQKILTAADGDEVNSISDTIEAEDAADVVETTFYNIVAPRYIPEHHEIIKLTAASDNSYPTHFHFPANVKEITYLWYEDDNGDYQTVYWKDPVEFLYLTDRKETYDSVSDKNAGTTLRIGNDADPSFYTSFDDYWVVMDSYDSSVESTLQESKIRALGTVYPVFNKIDSYTPDMDATLFPYLIAESTAMFLDLYKGGATPKVEQAARRQKSYIQNDMFRKRRKNKWSNYGR